MIEPCLAAVRPRVVSPETGDAVLLEDEVALWLEGRLPTLRIIGGPGSGKSTAMRHLAAVLGSRDDLVLIDDGGFAPERVLTDRRRLIYSAPTGLPATEDPTLQLARWDDDDLVEYCLTRHRQCCSSIIERIRAMPDARRLGGVPELWTLVIDTLAADHEVSDWRTVLKQRFAEDVPENLATPVRAHCLYRLVNLETLAEDTLRLLEKRHWSGERLKWLRHRAAQLVESAELVVRWLEKDQQPAFLAGDWPADLVQEVVRLLLQHTQARGRLTRVIASKHPQYHAVAATLLHALGQGWRPPPRTRANLTGANFAQAVWPGIDLSRTRLPSVDFSGADLSEARLGQVDAQRIKLGGANLTKAWLRDAKLAGAQAPRANLSEASAMNSAWQRADLQKANLRGANFFRAHLQHADFTDADLSAAALVSADLSDARLADTNCSGCDFRNATLRRVDLTTATLTGARFERADLAEANLEAVHWPAASLAQANLTSAHLTGAIMPGATLQGAVLRAAGLAGVDWEGADLRDADFTNSSFHLGSSRSGLVGSPIACEGSRTGFYTDDYLEQDFKSPEEIRKANLRGANLRGAIVEGTDFYLVDLRDARYTPVQAEHFRRCRAILVDRVEQ